MVAPKHVSIRGSMATIYRKYRNNTVIDKRMAVDSDWIRLWYAINEGNWDVHMWDHLSQKERAFLVRCTRAVKIESKQLEIAHAIDQKRDMDRLATLEGEVGAGNLSEQLVREYNEIVDELGYCYDLDPHYTGCLKHRMRNTLKAKQRD